MSDIISGVVDTPGTEASAAKVGNDASHIAEVKAWLASQFDAVAEFKHTPRSVSHLYNLASVSQAKTQVASLVANDFHQKASAYRSQAARIMEILENVGLAQESLPSNVVASGLILVNVANLLNIRDTELSGFLVAIGDISLRKIGVEQKSAKVQKESKILLDYTRKFIARLAYLNRTLAQLEDEIAPCEAQMGNWKTNLQLMASKECQYLQQYSNYKVSILLQQPEAEAARTIFIYKNQQKHFSVVWVTHEISHGVLVEMSEHRKELEKKTMPILETLRSYQDLPLDKALAALAIEDKKRWYAAAEKYFEDVLQSALSTSD